MSVIFCRREQVSHPYFIESLGVHVYTSQELCYVIYHYPLLAMDDFVNQNLIDFIRKELDMGFTALNKGGREWGRDSPAVFEGVRILYVRRDQRAAAEDQRVSEAAPSGVCQEESRLSV